MTEKIPIEKTRTKQTTVQREVIDKVRRSREIPAVHEDKQTSYSEQSTYRRNDLAQQIMTTVARMKSGIKNA